MKIEQIAIAEIVVADRLRATDLNRVSFLAESMEFHGLRQPVEVRKVKHDGSIRLVAGAHRLCAATQLDWTHIDAVIVAAANEDEARLLEIDENLVRHDLNAFDEARFLVERKAVYERLFPQTTWGGDRKSGNHQVANLATWSGEAAQRQEIQSFSEDIAARMGRSDRTIRRRITMYLRLTLEARRMISGSPLAQNASEIEAISKLPEGKQAEVTTAVVSGHDAKVRDAVMRLCRTEDQFEIKSRVQRTLDQVSRWSKAEQAELLRGMQGLAPVGYSVSTPFDDREGEAD